VTREVCRLQLLLDIASAVTVGSETSRTHDHILLSQIRDSLNLEDYVPVFISFHEQGVPELSPGSGFPFHLLRLAELRHSNAPPRGDS
jgi:hypothetical protein